MIVRRMGVSYVARTRKGFWKPQRSALGPYAVIETRNQEEHVQPNDALTRVPEPW